MNNQGKVYLIGAGPGDSGLITVRAKELIGRCDVLMFDYLTGEEIRGWAKPGCEVIDVGKRPKRHHIPQQEIEKILIEKAQAGKNVVRLKGGDPFVFGRGGEEAERLRDAGVSFEIVPGVTAALAAGAMCGIPLSHREYSSAITFLTGHEDPARQLTRLDFSYFAQVGGTLCIYMGMGHLAEIVEALLGHGLSRETPVAIVQNASLPCQKSVQTTLANAAQARDDAGLGSPAIVVVGAVAHFRESLNWFEARPLFGKRVVVTRSREQAGRLSTLLTEQGADVLELPLIAVDEEPASEREENVFSLLGSYQWIIFTSSNGVGFFFDKFHRRFEDIRAFGGLKIACVGEATAQAVREQRFAVDFVPATATGNDLAEGLLRHESLEHQNVLVITGNRNRDTLVKKLEDGMAIVDTFPVYRTDLRNLQAEPGAQRFRSEGADAVLFTSSSTVDSFTAQAANLQLAEGARHPGIVSIGPQTSARLKEKGLPVNAEAKEATLEALVEAVTALA